MATIGHLAIGLAAGRVHAGEGRRRIRDLLLFGILGALPDVDLLAIVLDHPYALPHRGATHSLLFAFLVAVVVAAAPDRWWPGTSRLRTGVVAFLAVVSHSLVDPLITGSGGTPLLWPFSRWRLTWGVQPIPEAFAGFEWPFVIPAYLALEALLFSPFLVYALWPRRRARVGASVPVPLPSLRARAPAERVPQEA